MTAAAVVRGMRRRHAGVAAVVWEQVRASQRGSRARGAQLGAVASSVHVFGTDACRWCTRTQCVRALFHGIGGHSPAVAHRRAHSLPRLPLRVARRMLLVQSAALGGRMRTTRDATPCDVGAQYYTPTVHGAAHVALLQEWQRAGLVRPFSDIGTTHTDHLAQDHYVALHGEPRTTLPHQWCFTVVAYVRLLAWRSGRGAAVLTRTPRATAGMTSLVAHALRGRAQCPGPHPGCAPPPLVPAC